MTTAATGDAGIPAPPRILLVDDEQNMLQAMTRVLGPNYQVITAQSARQGLDVLEKDSSCAVVVSDYRMPGGDGVTFLRRAREVSPSSVRLLLTGFPDLRVAMTAVNEGNVYRIMQKPCSAELLRTSVAAALVHHAQLQRERQLLAETLSGSITLLSNLLAAAQPSAYARAKRVKECGIRISAQLGHRDGGPLEVAAILSQVGSLTLPSDAVERLCSGEEAPADERRLNESLPAIAQSLLASIPLLAPVSEIVAFQQVQFDGTGSPREGVRGAAIPLGSRILKVALDFEGLQQRMSSTDALGIMRQRAGWYDPEVLTALAEAHAIEAPSGAVRQLRLREVQIGMAFAADVLTTDGVLLMARGQEVTADVMSRIQDFWLDLPVKEPIPMLTG